MKKEIDWDFIIDYLDGNRSREAEQSLTDWLASDLRNKETFDRMMKIWETPEDLFSRPDVEKALIKVKRRAGIQGLSYKRTEDRGVSLSGSSIAQRIWGSKLWKVAAVILLILLTPYLIFKLSTPSSLETILVKYAQKQNLILPDGSRVLLDAGTVFQYPQQFAEDIREVFLQGEGYFEITSEPNRTFNIHANQALVTVLGTKLNIRAWPKSGSVVVAVSEGEVSLHSKEIKSPRAEVLLSQGQISYLTENQIPSTPKYADIDAHLSWIKREKYFESIPLQEVLDQLERWYDIDFHLADQSFAVNRITIFIESKPLEEILELLSLVNNFQYERHGRKITFYQKKN